MYWFILVYFWFVAGMITVALLPRELPLAGNLLVIAIWPTVVIGMGIVRGWDCVSTWWFNDREALH